MGACQGPTVDEQDEIPQGICWESALYCAKSNRGLSCDTDMSAHNLAISPDLDIKASPRPMHSVTWARYMELTLSRLGACPSKMSLQLPKWGSDQADRE